MKFAACLAFAMTLMAEVNSQMFASFIQPKPIPENMLCVSRLT